MRSRAIDCQNFANDEQRPRKINSYQTDKKRQYTNESKYKTKKNTMQDSTNNIIRFLTCACTIFPGMKINALLKAFNNNRLTTRNRNINKVKVLYNNSQY